MSAENRSKRYFALWLSIETSTDRRVFQPPLLNRGCGGVGSSAVSRRVLTPINYNKRLKPSTRASPNSIADGCSSMTVVNFIFHWCTMYDGPVRSYIYIAMVTNGGGSRWKISTRRRFIDCAQCESILQGWPARIDSRASPYISKYRIVEMKKKKVTIM